MVPTKTDPLWKNFVQNEKDYAFTCLATKMMFTRVKQVMRDGDVDQAVTIAYEFFVNNFNIAKDDFELIKK